MGMTQTATKLIKRFGQAAILRSPGEVTGPDWNPTFGPPTDQPVTVAVTEYTIEERANSLIAQNDLRVFMAAGVDPSTADSLVIGGDEYSIKGIGRLGPDGTVIAFDLQVRR